MEFCPDYLSRKRNTAAARANKPVRVANNEPPNVTLKAAKPVNRKNRIMHQMEIFDGIFISYSPWVNWSLRLIVSVFKKKTLPP